MGFYHDIVNPKNAASLIDFVEAVYDLEIDQRDWLPNALNAGLPVLDHGLGVAGALYGLPPEGGAVEIRKLTAIDCPQDWKDRHLAAIGATPLEVLRRQSRPNQATTMSHSCREYPEDLERYVSQVECCADLAGITAVDPNGSGAAIIAPLAEPMVLRGRTKQRWEMLGAHLCAGHRIRQALRSGIPANETELPFAAEAIVDPQTFKVVAATSEAQPESMRDLLRRAAIRIDRARGHGRTDDPSDAFATWTALVRGRWSIVDWFDTDRRRFIVAVPNPPKVGNPRGLTERETQVVAASAYGMSNKLIAYSLGLSKSRVSALLHSGMRKLNVQTQAQLVQLYLGFDVAS